MDLFQGEELRMFIAVTGSWQDPDSKAPEPGGQVDGDSAAGVLVIIRLLCPVTV